MKLPLGLVSFDEFMRWHLNRVRRTQGVPKNAAKHLPVTSDTVTRARPPHGKRGAAPTPAMLADMAWRANDPWAYCGWPSDHWDHMHSRHRGGYNEPDNLIRACRQCNVSKRTRSPLVYMTLRANGLRA